MTEMTNPESRIDTGNTTNANPDGPRPVSPVLQFVLLIVPTVMTGFFMVYSLTGLILEGRDKYNWSLEAVTVSVRVGLGITLFSLLVLAFGWYKRLPRTHLLMLSGWLHLILAIMLTVAVFLIV